MTFFSANTNNKISRLSKNEKIKKQAGNSLAHLSFRSTAYVSCIAFYLIVKFLVITKEERQALLEEETEFNKYLHVYSII